MSSRQLRKLQQQKELERAAQRAEEGEQEEGESEEELSQPPKSKPSLFANLAALEEDNDDADEENDGESEHAAVSEPDEAPAPVPKPKKSKKKKKAKKNKAKDKTALKKEEAIDDIDAALRDLKVEAPSIESWHNSKPQFDPQFERICELVRIQTQYLKVANEMRNLFGRAALDNHDDAGGPIGRAARRQPRGQRQQVDLETALKGQHAPGKGLPEVTLRRNNFIQGKDEWPKATTGGLTMEIVEDSRQKDGTVEFRFVHNQAYQTMQLTFQALVEIGDPQNLIRFLTKNPYHISTLIQVSKIAKDQTDHALSSDLLERALFTFGRASISLFNTKLAEGKARLDFSRPENRELWLAGYQYIKSLIMKGTYRTAFEWAKLLLSLDPEDDPYCMRLLLHHLAIRAHEFQWLLALGNFALEQEILVGDERVVQASSFTIYHNTPSLALAALQLKESVKARDLLTQSMKRLPWLFARLFSALNLDSPPSIWGHQPRTNAEDLFTSLYVQQTKDLWNTTEGTAILMEIAHTIPKMDIDSNPVVSNGEMDLTVVRFIYLDNTPALMALVPSRLLHRDNNSDSDPVPPDYSTYSYRLRIPEVDARARGFHNPIGDIGQLFAQVRGENLENNDDDRDLEDLIRNGVGGLGDESHNEEALDADGPPPAGFAARILEFLLARPGPDSQAGGDITDSYDTDSYYTDSDELPDLIPADHNFGRGEQHGEHRDVDDVDNVETDDEMLGMI